MNTPNISRLGKRQCDLLAKLKGNCSMCVQVIQNDQDNSERIVLYNWYKEQEVDLIGSRLLQSLIDRDVLVEYYRFSPAIGYTVPDTGLISSFAYSHDYPHPLPKGDNRHLQ